MEYGQFCPVAKAMELLGEKWTLLILRELHMGATRFNELQRGLSLISPTGLSRRLTELVDAELILRKKIPGQRGYEYFLTPSGKDTLPLIQIVGEWGMRWARGDIKDTDLDVELLILYLKRSINAEVLPGNQSVIQFKFCDLRKLDTWWLVVSGSNVEICLEDPGKNIDVYVTTDLRTMVGCWMGEETYKKAIADKRMTLVGQSVLTRNIQHWITCSAFSDIPPANQI